MDDRQWDLVRVENAAINQHAREYLEHLRKLEQLMDGLRFNELLVRETAVAVAETTRIIKRIRATALSIDTQVAAMGDLITLDAAVSGLGDKRRCGT